MHKFVENEKIHLPYEEEVNGYTIFIDVNPDHWRGGFVWSVCIDGAELDSGLAFDVTDAIGSANNAIDALVSFLRS
ncbi:hypothetical protein GCM10010919_01820 [Alishewanella longhuensis]|uniref:Phage protein n=1 Tax=Alishewanella longhuensis TaxID=1091037 RepID=A0ABQ3KT65_9ALTE|nr:hypothetical protein [Alishewanella longhuensis]GHG59369.1 hypothetical protein GCM10010919_01820 [Alishewanella longhuensis]